MHRLIAFAVTLGLLVVSGALGLMSVLGQSETAPSAIPDGAMVIAQGVAPFPSDDLAWRVTRATVPPESARPQRDLPGFVLADSGALLLTDDETDARTRLVAGEAAFAPAGARFQEEALQDPLSYYRIDLVPPEEAENAGNDEMVFVGNPFPSPGGDRDMDLASHDLAAGETVDLALEGQATPVLLLVTAGEVGLVPASNPSADPVPLPAGQGAALGGDVIATASDAGATYVLAIVGPDVDDELAIYNAPTPTPVPTATPVPQVATLAVQALACPAGYAGDQYATDCVDPLAGVSFSVAGQNTGAAFDGATGDDGFAAFGDLPADTYTVIGGIPAGYSTPVVACDAASAAGIDGGSPGATVTLDPGVYVTCTWYAVSGGAQGEGEGSVAVSVHYCPGTPVDPFADCVAGDPSGIVIDGPAGAALDSSGQSGALPYGSYFLQPGGIGAPEGYQISEVRGSAGGSGNGWSFVIDEANPNPALQVIFVPAGGEVVTPPAEGEAEAPAEPDGFNTDSDADGVSDAQEETLGTDPTNPDTDGDGVMDSSEVVAGTDPLVADGEGTGEDAIATTVPGAQDPGTDSDGDGLTDMQEASLGTNPNAEDSDGDHLADGIEAGLPGGFAIGTNPTNPDTDGDGVSDAVELANDTDPTDPASS